MAEFAPTPIEQSDKAPKPSELEQRYAILQEELEILRGQIEAEKQKQAEADAKKAHKDEVLEAWGAHDVVAPNEGEDTYASYLEKRPSEGIVRDENGEYHFPNGKFASEEDYVQQNGTAADYYYQQAGGDKPHEAEATPNYEDLSIIELAREKAKVDGEQNPTNDAGPSKHIQALAEQLIKDQIERAHEDGRKDKDPWAEGQGLSEEDEYEERLQQFDKWVEKFADKYHSRLSESNRSNQSEDKEGPLDVPATPDEEAAPEASAPEEAAGATEGEAEAEGSPSEEKRTLRQKLETFARDAKPKFTWAYWKGRWNGRVMSRRSAAAENEQAVEAENKKTRRKWMAGSLALFAVIVGAGITGEVATDHAAQEHSAENTIDEHDNNRQFWENLEQNKAHIEVPAPAQTPETAQERAAFNVSPGEGGIEMFQKAGLTEADWYAHQNDLLNRFPSSFYRMPDNNVGLRHPGTLPSTVQTFIVNGFKG